MSENLISNEHSKAHASSQESAAADIGSEGFSNGGGDSEAVLLDPDLSITIMTHSDIKGNYSSLYDFCPAYVVLYDPDISIIRSIETYQSQLRPEAPAVKVYFILYGQFHCFYVLFHHQFCIMSLLFVTNFRGKW